MYLSEETRFHDTESNFRYRRHAYFLSETSSAKVFTIKYRKAPYYPFPCGLIDALSGYLELLKVYRPEDIVVVGDSAGGGLAASMLLLVKEMGFSCPGAAYLQSPWVSVYAMKCCILSPFDGTFKANTANFHLDLKTNLKVDLTNSFPSFLANSNDYLPELPTDQRLERIGRINYYAGNEDAKERFVSPIFGKFDGLSTKFLIQGMYFKFYELALFKNTVHFFSISTNDKSAGKKDFWTKLLSLRKDSRPPSPLKFTKVTFTVISSYGFQRLV